MKLFKSVDEKLAEIGFEKAYQSGSGVVYRRPNEKFKIVQIVTLSGCNSVINVTKSYTDDRYGSALGLTGYEMKLFVKKMKKMGWYSGKKVTMDDFRRHNETESVRSRERKYWRVLALFKIQRRRLVSY